MGFKAPYWESQPCRTASLEVVAPDGTRDTVPVDSQPHYVLGRNADTCDITLPDDSCSREHAALVHHEDGRLFLIDLGSTHGTTVDGRKVAPNKPLHLHNGVVLQFGTLVTKYFVKCEDSGSKRHADDDKGMVRASHLLVKHRDSRRPSSWKEPNISRSKEEALAMINAFRERITSGAVEFAALAATESHCSSARRGGDLGEFGPGQMQPAFEHATYALSVGELSQPVFSDSGVHLILRTA